MTSFNQSGCTISAWHSYALLKIIYNIDCRAIFVPESVLSCHTMSSLRLRRGPTQERLEDADRQDAAVVVSASDAHVLMSQNFGPLPLVSLTDVKIDCIGPRYQNFMHRLSEHWK